jgi:hypothetical protein
VLEVRDMTTYELRAEHRPAEVGRMVRRWHIAHARRLKGWCGRLLDPVADVLPLAHATDVEPRLRCPDCWRLFATGQAFTSWGEGPGRLTKP